MNLNHLSDEELMVMYQNGDEGAFQVLYSRHSGRIFAFIRSKISDAQLAGDLFQEVFIKVHKSKCLYNRTFEVLPWLFTITRNTVIDGLRKNKSHLYSEDHDVEKLEAPGLVEALSQKDLAPAMAKLPEAQRQAIQMRYIDESTFEEIAKKLDTSSDNVRQLVSRGIKNMKNFFNQEEK